MTAATEVKLRRGTTAQHATFTGAAGEVTVDTTTKSLVVHDGATVGGKRQASQEYVDTAVASLAAGNFQNLYLFGNVIYP